MNENKQQLRKWLVKPAWQTCFGIVWVGVALFVAYRALFPLNPRAPIPQWVSIVAVLAAALGLRAVLQGGCSIDFEKNCLIRWWGIFLPIYRRSIPLNAIDQVKISSGLYPSASSTYDLKGRSFNVAVGTANELVLIKQGLQDYNSARTFAKAIGAELGLSKNSSADSDAT